MKAVQTVLAVIAVVALSVQTVRHGYLLWFEPRASVLDRFEQPLKDQIAAATSVQQLVPLYEKARAEAEKARRAERRSTGDEGMADLDTNMKALESESQLRQAIQDWEAKARELHALRFYWLTGLAFLLVGLVVYRVWSEPLGLALELAAFSEFIYWTSPSFFGGPGREYHTLLVWKLGLTAASLALLLITAALQGAFRRRPAQPVATGGTAVPPVIPAVAG